MSGEAKKMRRRLGGALALAALATLMFAPSALASWSISEFDGALLQRNGDTAVHAGSHPHTGVATFSIPTTVAPPNNEYPTEYLKNVHVKLPAGLVGNPQAIDSCTESRLQFSLGHGLDPGGEGCPLESQVGVITLYQDGAEPSNVFIGHYPIFNMVAPKGTAALFGFDYAGNVVHFYAKVRSGTDYGVDIVQVQIPTTVSIPKVITTLWGVPADPAWDGLRGSCMNTDGTLTGGSCPSSLQPKPFISLPTSCVGPVDTFLTIDTWEGSTDTKSFTSHDNSNNPVGNSGCNALDFSPTMQARPTSNVADSPTGLDVDLHFPQNEDPEGFAEAHLKDATVAFPEGLVINPSGANGLDGCSTADVGLTSAIGATPITYTPDEATCPEASKVGSVQIDTPLLDHPLPGAVYVAKPHDNPFNSLLAVYIAGKDPQTGVVFKIAGKVTPSATGQLTSTFENNPQVPVEDIVVHLFGGAAASLKTPPTCGTYSTTSSLTPWSAPDSGPPATPSDTWAIEQGPGGSCATDQSQLPNTPSLDAGTVSPIAGAESPMVINLRRNDATQQFHSLTLTPPQGLVARLAGIPYCPEDALAAAAAKSGRAEEASPSCPSASMVGSVSAAAGAGPAPYYAPGKAYLTGPYKGAPLSIAIVTPATAGPFDLGTIVVRTALYVDRTTTRITAVSDPIPSVLQGIPLDVRSVQVRLDHAGWGINPTSCDPSTFDGQLLSTLGQIAPLQSRFQVGECGRLAFKPQLTLALKGGTKRAGHPALTATLTMPPGSANLAAISVALPHSEFLDQSHIGTVCTRVQFKADQCPAASVYGEATVDTPILDYPLHGLVYLRSSDNLLPDLVPDFRGPAFQPIQLEADGRVDSVKGGIRNTFDFVPDAPFTKLTLSMQGGKKGLLENSTDLCRKVQRATVKYAAHNGATLTAKPALKVKCPKLRKGKKGKRVKRHARRG